MQVSEIKGVEGDKTREVLTGKPVKDQTEPEQKGIRKVSAGGNTDCKWRKDGRRCFDYNLILFS